MKLPRIFYFAFFLLIPLTGAYAQEYHTVSFKAVKAYKEGLTCYDYLDYKNAESYFKQAIEVDDKFFEAYMMLGELQLKLKNYSAAAGNLQKAIYIDSLVYKPAFFSLATSEFMSGDYEKALVHYKNYLKLDKISETNRAEAVKNVRNCEFAIEALKNPVPFNPESVGKGINTPDNEYWPSITADGQTMMFTRQAKPVERAGLKRIAQEDFYISSLSHNTWQTAVNAGSPLNTAQNEGAQTLSSDGTYMYFTACERSGGFGSCDIYFSAFNDGRWSYPVNLGSPVNTSKWESQPSVSANGRMLFFSSSRTSGEGGKDLWYSILGKDGKWGEPVNLGAAINTPGDEMSPFIHFDGKTLYFASNGRPGMGGFDIYKTRMNDDSTWTEPQNLGYPINTFNDEMGLVIESDGRKAYFSSERDKENGKDIFSFDLYEAVRPDPVAYFKGQVTDKETGKMLVAGFELINLSTGKSVVSSKTDRYGNFLVCIPLGYDYALNITKPGYLFFSQNFMFEGSHPVLKPYLMHVNLSPLKVGEKMVLTNVFYETDSWELKKESLSELDKLLDLLNENRQLIVEIGGYTDATGNYEHNIVLSEKRALSVVNFLVDNGISSDRLKYKGYGDTSPIGDNITPEGRRLNRRTEVKILEIKE
jgi:tetratricopeptide (TPR) repeat protein